MLKKKKRGQKNEPRERLLIKQLFLSKNNRLKQLLSKQ